MSTPPFINRLPEELFLSIFELLDAEPPSITKSRQEPSLDITTSNNHSYKDLSSVSRRWRRIILPLLFRFSRIYLDPRDDEIENLDDFLQLVRMNSLKVESVVVYTTKKPDDHLYHRHNPEEVPAFWNKLLDSTRATRILIVAPPADLAHLTQCTIDLSTEWAFEEMDFHLLELRCGDDTTGNSSRIFEPNPNKIAAESILMMKPWSHLALNEGSFIKAYSTYEYFERGPPSLVYSIMNCFSSSAREKLHATTQEQQPSSSLRSFSYTAILPFADHLDFRAILPHLDELDVQLAPDPSSNILNDRSRIGRAQMEDCWQEFVSAYRLLTRSFRTFSISADGSPKLKRFVCRDFQIPALAEDLDDEFMPLCMPCWCEDPRGVFSRLAASPPRYD